MTTHPPVNMTTPSVVAVHYAPSPEPETAAFPWLIAAERTPLTRVAAGEHALQALQMFPEIYAEEWGPAPAMHNAVSHTAPGGDPETVSTAPTTRSVSEEPGTGHAVSYTPEDPEAPGRLPWTLLDPQGRPVARVAAGEHALDALQALPGLLDQDTTPADPVAAALDASRRFKWDSYAPADAEELQP